jgi:hypothetical protein
MWNWLNIINILFCALIFVIAYFGYHKNKNSIVLLIGLAFAIFGIAHIFALFGLTKTLQNILIVIRIVGYLLVLFVLYKVWKPAQRL